MKKEIINESLIFLNKKNAAKNSIIEIHSENREKNYHFLTHCDISIGLEI